MVIVGIPTNLVLYGWDLHLLLEYLTVQSCPMLCDCQWPLWQLSVSSAAAAMHKRQRSYQCLISARALLYRTQAIIRKLTFRTSPRPPMPRRLTTVSLQRCQSCPSSAQLKLAGPLAREARVRSKAGGPNTAAAELATRQARTVVCLW